MAEFRKLDFDGRAKVCFAIAEDVFAGAPEQRKVQGSLKMCQCMMAFADNSGGMSPADSERTNRAASVMGTARACSLAR